MPKKSASAKAENDSAQDSPEHKRPGLPVAYARVGNVILYRRDCAEVLAALPSGSVQAIVTDPPYAVDYRGRWDGRWEDRPMTGDRTTGWIEPIFAELLRVAAPDSYCVTFYGWPNIDAFMSAWKRVGWKPVSHLCVVKQMLGLGIHSRSRHETAFVLVKGKPRPTGRRGGPQDVIVVDGEATPELPEDKPDVIVSHDPTPRKGRLHSSQKPLSAVRQIVEAYSPTGAWVLDPFCGSGTTLVACRDAGRKAIGVDDDDTNCQNAVARLRA